MRLILVHLIFCLIVLSPGISFASRAIFFQPQERDLEIPPANWPVIFNGVRERGIDTLIIQWNIQHRFVPASRVICPHL